MAPDDDGDDNGSGGCVGGGRGDNGGGRDREDPCDKPGYVGGGSADDDDDDTESGGDGPGDTVGMNPDVRSRKLIELGDLNDEDGDVEFSVPHCAACESSWNGARTEYRETL